ncbi:transcriptional regulator, XRE family [Maricaulis maris MCS10]|uniref:Transcriptional regulator, XRE family n=1 Tax=Maricaulis maris (strain MCS10) TaxID=394221 RepID=Q0ALH9_MARMM|nr:helix-turn-helix domain-containing protein [Maricaulis maris]ABI66864.1 transcriptional regulator, XRE family [Maricaulis maris MCS10]
MSWVNKIKELRHFEDIKQDALALQLGVSQASVSQWERGVSEPPPNIQSKLLKRLAKTPAARFIEALRVSVRTSPNVAGLLVDRDEGVVFDLISDSAAELTEFLGHDDVGKPIHGLFGPDVDAQLGRLVEAGLFEGRVESASGVTLLHRHGKIRPVELSLTSFRVPHSEVIVRLEVRIPTPTDQDPSEHTSSLKIVRDKLFSLKDLG